MSTPRNLSMAGGLQPPYCLTVDEWHCVVAGLKGIAEMVADAAEDSPNVRVTRNTAAIIAQVATILQDSLPILCQPVDNEG